MTSPPESRTPSRSSNRTLPAVQGYRGAGAQGQFPLARRRRPECPIRGRSCRVRGAELLRARQRQHLPVRRRSNQRLSCREVSRPPNGRAGEAGGTRSLCTTRYTEVIAPPGAPNVDSKRPQADRRGRHVGMPAAGAQERDLVLHLPDGLGQASSRTSSASRFESRGPGIGRSIEPIPIPHREHRGEILLCGRRLRGERYHRAIQKEMEARFPSEPVPTFDRDTGPCPTSSWRTRT